MDKASQRQMPIVEDGEWLRNVNAVLLLHPTWIDVNEVLSSYIIQFVRELCAKKPAVEQVMFDVVGHRLVEAAMGVDFEYKPHLLKEPYMSKSMHQRMKRDVHYAMMEFLTRRMRKDSFFSSAAMKDFQKTMQEVYQARVHGDVDTGNVSDHAGQALVYLLRHRKPEAALLFTSGGSDEYVNNSSLATARYDPDKKKEDEDKAEEGKERQRQAVQEEGKEDEEEDTQETDLWDVVEGEVMPPSIRKYLWARRLADGRKEHLWHEDLRRHLDNADHRYQPGQRKSAIAALIDAGVSQLLDDIRPILQVTPAQALCMERLLDQHYAISGRYTRRYVNLLLPLLLVFPGRDPDVMTVEETSKLLTMLSLLYVQIDPQTLPRRALASLQRRAPHVEAHLNRLFFNQSLEATDPSRASSSFLRTIQPKADDPKPRTRTLLTLATSITAIFNYWIEEAFVGILRPAALMLVWDNCILFGWEEQLPEFCVDLLGLMGDDLLLCTTAREAVLLLDKDSRDVLTEELQEVFKTRRAEEDSDDSDSQGRGSETESDESDSGSDR